LSTFTVSGHMLDVGTLESYIKAHITTEKENWISKSSEVDPSAVIENTVILDDAIIEKNTEIKNSIIGPKTRIKEGSVIEEEIVRDLTQ
jgi:NDP-sugar pyrophosphorylase family protein